MLGRESAAKTQRVERLRQWLDERSRLAVVSVPLGVLAVVDFFTVVLGLAFGIAAIALAWHGRKELQANPKLRGHAFAKAGMGLGVVGILASLVMWFIFY